VIWRNSFHRAQCHLTEDRIRALADGRIYTGMEAKELGLVDHVGYLEDAIAAATSMAGVKDASIVAYDRGDGYRGSIYAKLSKFPSDSREYCRRVRDGRSPSGL
jgi:protease-4